MQQTSYYPFGMTKQQQNFYGPLSEQNKMLYNSKELQDDVIAGIGFDWYDYGARFYDPQLARWYSVDPLAELAYGWTPYRYGFNNPISFIDPEGMFQSRQEAKEWAEKENIKTGFFSRHKIEKCEDGTYAINNRRDSVSFFSDSSLQTDEGSITLGLHSDGVIESALVSATAGGGGESWYSIYNWPALGSSAKTMDALDGGDYLSAVGHFLTCGAEVFTFGMASKINLGVKGGQTIIGEGMKRVSMEAAKLPGSVILNKMPKFTGTADQVTSQMMAHNRKWLLKQMRSGRPILDIGLDATRTNPSIFYQMEQNMVRNYLKLHPNAFQYIKP